uniref:Uncharacterized protein n=1 Tax=Anguilla anguilla TaxID=7936 RepID=A0A0E9T8I7_ANGAN
MMTAMVMEEKNDHAWRQGSGLGLVNQTCCKTLVLQT